MPPKTDPQLEGRILKAAERLWSAKGEDGLTLRAVARQAGTTTPTVYKRFRNKRALQIALAHRFRDELIAECLSAKTLEEIHRRYVRFAEDQPHKYELLWLTWSEVFHPGRPRPIRAWLVEQLAKRFGGKPADYELTFYAVFLLSHGAATLLTIPGDEEAHKEVRENFLAICDAILRRGEMFGRGSGARREARAAKPVISG